MFDGCGADCSIEYIWLGLPLFGCCLYCLGLCVGVDFVCLGVLFGCVMLLFDWICISWFICVCLLLCLLL